MRRAAHIDDNQVDIVIALQNAGCTTQSTASLGAGFPDVIVGFKGVNVLMEIKNPLRDTPSQRRADRDSLEAQAKFRKYWNGQVAVVTTPQEALDVVAAEYLRLSPAAK
jgi:hypothetical protein